MENFIPELEILSSHGESAQLILTDNGAQMVVCLWNDEFNTEGSFHMLPETALNFVTLEALTLPHPGLFSRNL